MFSLLTIPWFKPGAIEIPGIGLELQPFGMLVAIGVLFGVRIAEWRANKVGLRAEPVSDLCFHVLLVGFVFGHLFDIVLYHPDLFLEQLLNRPWELLYFWTSLSSFGGFFGAVLGGLLWRWRRSMPLLPGLDAVAFALPFGWFFGRMGCFVVHDHPGAKTDFFLGVANYQYPGFEVATRHDLGLYEVMWSAIVFPLFVYLGKKPRPHGFFVAWISLLYAPVRFGLDFLREADKTYGALTPGHYSSIVTLALGLWALWLCRNWKGKIPENMKLPAQG